MAVEVRTCGDDVGTITKGAKTPDYSKKTRSLKIDVSANVANPETHVIRQMSIVIRTNDAAPVPMYAKYVDNTLPDGVPTRHGELIARVPDGLNGTPLVIQAYALVYCTESGDSCRLPLSIPFTVPTDND